MVDALSALLRACMVGWRLRRAQVWVPVLMLVLTVRGAVGDRVTGMGEGADDYLTKPFHLDELLARMRALVRRGTTRAHRAGCRTAADRHCEPPLLA
jgi:two-component system, OmpR family, response regulator